MTARSEPPLPSVIFFIISLFLHPNNKNSLWRFDSEEPENGCKFLCFARETSLSRSELSFPTLVHLKQWRGFYLNLNSVHPGFGQCGHVWRITALGLLRGLRVWRIIAWPPRKEFISWASQVVLVVKKLPANGGDVRVMGSIPGSGRSPGGEHSNPLQYSGLGNPMDRGACQATEHRVAQS